MRGDYARSASDRTKLGGHRSWPMAAICQGKCATAATLIRSNIFRGFGLCYFQACGLVGRSFISRLLKTGYDQQIKYSINIIFNWTRDSNIRTLIFFKVWNLIFETWGERNYIIRKWSCVQSFCAHTQNSCVYNVRNLTNFSVIIVRIIWEFKRTSVMFDV